MRDSERFLYQTDKLAAALQCGIDELPDFLGVSRASFYGYRRGQRNISGKAWAKLEAAEERVRRGALDDTVQIEVDRQEVQKEKRKELSELILQALEMAQEENTDLRERLAAAEAELARLKNEVNRESA